jgi:hypothetical protein
LTFIGIDKVFLIAFKLAESLTLDLRIESIYTIVITIEVYTAQQCGTQFIVISRVVTARSESTDCDYSQEGYPEEILEHMQNGISVVLSISTIEIVLYEGTKLILIIVLLNNGP